MQIQLECIPCFIRQGLDALNQVTDDDKVIERALRRVLADVSTIDFSLSPPSMGQRIHEIIREESQNNDPYKQIKQQADQCALGLYDEVKEKISKSDYPFISAVRFAISGNILDFALLTSWDDDFIQASFDKALYHPINEDNIKGMEKETLSAKSILILGDNTGETVFDKLLIETMNTDANIYYAVKNSPIINDATLDDAKNIGLDEVCTVISNGTNAPGTVLEICSKEFLNIYNSADVVIAKGQANFETLNNENRQIYFLTQMKCKVIANKYNYKVGDWIVTSTGKLKETKEVTI